MSGSRKYQKFQFTQKNNLITGKMEWLVELEEDHDHFTDIARSSYADMLHDDERNKMYRQAITLAIQSMHERGMKAKVLDIGTGTGLLAMMAAQAGADVVTAVEVFSPMADIARRVTELNRFPQIKVINKHSTDMKVGEDIEERANVLVTELFDTELIGEGALSAYQHAHRHLMEEDCLAVPHLATIKAVLVESPLMSSWNQLKPLSIKQPGGGVVEVRPNPEMVDGCGITAVHDIQLSQFPQDQLNELTEPFDVFEFDWSNKKLSDDVRTKVLAVRAIHDGSAQIVLSWWDLQMDRGGEIVLSTAPRWHHPSGSSLQWRDHWLQSVYFLPRAVSCNASECINVQASHDAYSLWFNASIDKELINQKAERPQCEYLPRMLWGRPRLGRVNDVTINRLYVQVLHRISGTLRDDDVIVCASDFSLLPLFAAKTCPKAKIVAMERTKLAQRGQQNLARHNNVTLDVALGESPDMEEHLHGRKVALFCGEPHFTSSLLPWHDLYFWYVRSAMTSLFSDDVHVMPCRAHLCACAVHFDDLWKIRAPVGEVEGFDISPMDSMIERALEKKEYHEAEPHALWEYPCHILTAPVKVMTFDLEKLVPDHNICSRGVMTFAEDSRSGACHGVVLWMEYDLDADHTLSTGLLSQGCEDGPPSSQWSMHHKQAVYLFKRPIALSNKQVICYDVTFLSERGDITMNFTVT